MSHLADLFIDATWFLWVPGFGFGLGLPPESFSVSAVFSGIGATILGKFTGEIGFATMPMNYVALFVGALLGNWALADAGLPFDPRLQAPILFALAGMAITGLSMMFVLRRD